MEPTKIQLYNKIAHVKKVCNLAESLDNTHELREKIKQYLEVPENDIESYVAHSKIEDENNEEEVRFVIIFTTKRILGYLKQSKNIHLDCTYRLNWNKFPVCVVGTTNITGLFFPTMTILSVMKTLGLWLKSIVLFTQKEFIPASGWVTELLQ